MPHVADALGTAQSPRASVMNRRLYGGAWTSKPESGTVDQDALLGCRAGGRRAVVREQCARSREHAHHRGVSRRLDHDARAMHPAARKRTEALFRNGFARTAAAADSAIEPTEPAANPANLLN